MAIYSDPSSVDARLAETFGVTRDDLIQVVKDVVGARADAVENDPVSAGGLFAYIHGTRNIRGLFRMRGWQLYRKDNIELVKHPDRDLMVSYQSVDLAASAMHSPLAVSGKGAGAERVIDEAQMSLDIFSQPAAVVAQVKPIVTGMWFFCVSVLGEDVRAELSLASGVSGGNFKGFIERIFIVNGGEWDDLRTKRAPYADVVEFNPVVVRK